MAIHIYDCEVGHTYEKWGTMALSRWKPKCEYVLGSCEDRGHAPDPTHVHTLSFCGKPAKRREVYAVNFSMGKDGTRNSRWHMNMRDIA